MRRLITLIAIACAGTFATAQSNATVFEGARIIVGDGSAPIENGAFVVENGRFTQVGAKVKAPAGAARVDLKGKTVMPGIIDTHVHIPTTNRTEMVDALQRKAFYGATVVLSLGLDGDIAYQARNETISNAASILTAGRGITMPEPGRSDVPYWITSAAEGRKAVQELAAKKPDIIKIWVDDRNGKYKKLTADLYGPIIEEAHKHSLRVTAHIYALDDAKGLLRAGVDAFAHSVREKDVDDEFMKLVKERPRVVLVPNLPDRGVATDVSWLRDSVSEGEFKKLQAAAVDRPAAQESFGIQARNLAKLNSAGMRIALGTDGNIPWAHHVEMEDMVASGMTPHQVIVASTRNGADFLMLKDHGTITSGKVADFLVLDANPIDDIKNTRKISAVYLRGAALDRTVKK